MPIRYTKDADFRSGDAFAAALFGAKPGKSFYQVVEDNMQQGLKEELPALDRAVNNQWPPGRTGRPGEIPRWDTVQIGRTRLKNWDGLPYYLLPEFNIGDTANWYADPGLADDLWPILTQIQKQLVRKSPQGRAPGVYGAPSNPQYHKAHRIFFDGVHVTSRPRSPRPGAFGWVVNLTEYASTLETPDFSYQRFRTYQKVFRWAVRRFSDDADIMLMFGDPNSMGGHLYTKRWAQRRRPVYAVPLIAVAPLNLFPRSQRSQFNAQFRRTLNKGSRSKGIRMNVLAIQRRRRRS
ncbi:MAG: hypothetical protein ACK2UO_02145 [Caldilineaceae bacterium]